MSGYFGNPLLKDPVLYFLDLETSGGNVFAEKKTNTPDPWLI